MKLIIFDLDGTLIKGRTILFLGREFGFYKEAAKIMESDTRRCLISQRLARLLGGIHIDDFIGVIKKIPLTEGAAETVHRLISMGHRTAIITDGYDVVAEYFKKKLGVDKAVGNRLIIEGSRITGSLEMPLNCSTEEECGYPSVCKKEIMKAMCSEFGIPLSETVAIGDNKIDICMLKEAGIGIAFNPKTKELEDAADVVIKGEDLREVLRYIHAK